MKIKPYSELKIGDQVYHCEDKEFIGIVTWLGKAKDLHPNELLDWEMTPTELEELGYDILKVDESTGAFDDCIRLYNYNCDPSGVEAYEPTSYFFSLEDYQFHGTKPKGPIVFIQKDFCTKITKSSIFVQIFLRPRRAPSARTPARRTTGGLGCPSRTRHAR